MKFIPVILLGLCSLTISNAWYCSYAPKLLNAQQIDAGLGNVVARDNLNIAYSLIGEQWQRLSTIRFKHVSVGPAGLWGCDTTNRVYKFVAGNFQCSSGASLQQVDAGGNDHIVGVQPNNQNTYCLSGCNALTYSGVGSLRWSSLAKKMRYYSCGTKFGCWGVDRSYRVYVAKNVNTENCNTSGWTQVTGLYMKMVEVGTDGSVFGVTKDGKIYQRVGITSQLQEGKKWVPVPMSMTVRHVSYDLGTLWAVTNSGVVMKCTS
ncbi:fish-egg lectin-like [Etheostoma cragini]|uniref:fish-egg lectin-like n=1 Tax=Etheostoma cragini TaxID=417921 RepID=UPI00155F416A|nr:fish-egg lectin-like [Etheostoma cragini]